MKLQDTLEQKDKSQYLGLKRDLRIEKLLKEN